MLIFGKINQEDCKKLANSDVSLCFTNIIKNNPSLSSDAIAWLARFMNACGFEKVRITREQWTGLIYKASEPRIKKLISELEYLGILVKLAKANVSPNGNILGTYITMYINKNCY